MDKSYIFIVFLVVVICCSFKFSTSNLKNDKNKRNFGYIPKERKNDKNINSDIFIHLDNFENSFFTDYDYINLEPFISLSEFDYLGRVGIANAVISNDMLNETKNMYIEYRPTGFIQRKYSEKYLYNRCHLIGYQLIGNNDTRNLMTGTHNFNVLGMMPIENSVYEFLKNNGNALVKYMVIPYFKDDELIARGKTAVSYSI